MIVVVRSAAFVILAVLGGLLVLAAALAAGLCAVALIERLGHGRGIMFADAEVLGFLALACAVPGALMLMGARRLRRRA